MENTTNHTQRSIKLFLIPCLILGIFFVTCSCMISARTQIASIWVQRGSGYVVKNESSISEEQQNWIIMDTKIDDFSISSAEAIQSFVSSLQNEEPTYVDCEMKFVEMNTFLLRYKDGSETRVTVVYDYQSEREYVWFEGNFYLLQTGSFTNDFLKPYVLNKYGDQSESKFCNPRKHSFRYIQYWRDDRTDSTEIYELTEIEKNSSLTIRTEQDAINHAITITETTPTDIAWYYDEITGYWMVRLFDETNPFISQKTSAPSAYVVVMNSEGMILESFIANMNGVFGIT